MIKYNTLSLAIIMAMSTLCSTSVMSAGFQEAGYSATGLGRAYAGEAAMPDNASAQFRNPSLLTYLPKTQISTGFIYKDPNIDVEGIATSNSGQTLTTRSDDYVKSSIIPNFYLSHQVNEQVFLGLALASNYAINSQLDDAFKAIQFGQEATVRTFEINPNVAYRINEQFSVGGGIRFVLGEGSIGRKSAGGLLPAGTTLQYVKGDDFSFGWQLGAVWQINPNNRIGLNYRSAVNLNLEGYATGASFGGAGEFDASMDLTLPATSEISSFHQINEKISLHSSLNWTDWNSYKRIETQIPSLSASPILIQEHNWMSSYRLALGGTYQLDDKTRLRAGIAYDLAAANDVTRTVYLPEADRMWFSVGAGYDYSAALTLDVGFSYIRLANSGVNGFRPCFESDLGSLPYGGDFKGNITGHAWLVGVQASYRF